MAKLPRLTGKELAKIAEEFGFIYSHTTGSHMVYKHPDGRRTTIPSHTGEEIGPGLLTKIVKKDFGNYARRVSEAHKIIANCR